MAHPPPANKLHAACDECRTRKLRCSGARPVCARCAREGVVCVYSVQKTMGRPRKRRREGEPGGDAVTTCEGGGGMGFSSWEPPSASVSDVYVAALVDGEGGMYTTEHDKFSLTPPIDPSLWPTHPPPPPTQPLSPCPCLSLTYLTLTSLQTIPRISFPQTIPPLRRATRTITTLLTCPTCPLSAFSASQNTSSLTSLFLALTARYAALLSAIDAEAAHLQHAGATKPFRIGDASAALAHLHSGVPDCPLGFDVRLQPGVWRVLVKAALRTEVLGGGRNAEPLGVLLDEAEERQRRWCAQGVFGEGEMGGEVLGACLGSGDVRRALGG
ncbi:hypothetical protein EJ07DRAFT_161670 [Lizonia empirigonia]|nr:hypothetical protein EJ07DRAFT_161670 [Lizonia empirigonia]